MTVPCGLDDCPLRGLPGEVHRDHLAVVERLTRLEVQLAQVLTSVTTLSASVAAVQKAQVDMASLDAARVNRVAGVRWTLGALWAVASSAAVAALSWVAGLIHVRVGP